MWSVPLPRRLKAVPELGSYEIHVGALSKVHIGMLICVAMKRNTITGRLDYVPLESVGRPGFLVVKIGDYSVCLHPAATVTVVPQGFKATVVVERKALAPTGATPAGER